jgi:hypothetical protein
MNIIDPFPCIADNMLFVSGRDGILSVFGSEKDGIMRDKFEPEKLAVAQGIFVSMFSVGCSIRSGHRLCLLYLICNLFGGHDNSRIGSC